MSSAKAKTYQYKDINPRTRRLRFLVVVILFLSIVSSLHSGLTYFTAREALAAEGAQTPATELTGDYPLLYLLQEDWAILATTVPFLLVLLVYGITFFRWIYRAMANLWARGDQTLQTTPAMAVIWFFVPLFFLWRPYYAVKEIYQRYTNPADSKQVQSPDLLYLWWFFFLASEIAARFSARLPSENLTLEQFVRNAGIESISGILNTIYYIVLFLFVGLLGKRMRQADSLATPEPEALANPQNDLPASDRSAAEVLRFSNTDQPS